MLIQKNTNIQITDLRDYLLMKKHGHDILEYLSRKNHWTPEALVQVDWAGLDQCLKKAGILKRIKLLQLMHDWQNVGSQKRKFHEARDSTTNSTLPPTTQTQRDEEKCPAQCGELEGNLHYMKCKAETMRTERTKLLASCRKNLTRIDTDPAIIDITIWSILQYSDKDMAAEYSVKLQQWREIEILNRIMINQKKLGQASLLKGFIVKDWSWAQKVYWKDRPKRKYSTIGWTTTFIQTILDVTVGMWKHRNELIHGKTLEETKSLQRKRLQERVDELFAEKERLFLPHSKGGITSDLAILATTRKIRPFSHLFRSLFLFRALNQIFSVFFHSIPTFIPRD